jgi:large subunit ribosomal protein L25
MSSGATLVAEPRSETGKRPAGRLRRAGKVPAVVYGLGSDAMAVTVVAHDLARILSGASGANTVITLRVDGADQLTLPRQVQRDPVKGTLVHVDFVRVRADQAIEAEVPLHLVGDAEGVAMGGMLEQHLFTLKVRARPGEIPTAIEHDMTPVGIGDHVYVRDLVLPSGVELLQEPDEVVVHLVVPRGTEAEEAAASAAAASPAEGEAAGAAGGSESEA